MNLEVKLFAVAKQLAGRPLVTVELPEPATVADLRRELARQVPELAAIVGQTLFAVGEEYAVDATPLLPGSEVACIPPVSGG